MYKGGKQNSINTFYTYRISQTKYDWVEEKNTRYMFCYTDKKENKIGAKSYCIWLTASSYMVKYLCISSYIRKPFLIYDFAPDPIWISIYMRKILFSFLSVYHKVWSAPTSYFDFICDFIEESAHWLCRKWVPKTRKCGKNLTMTLD